MASLSNSDSSTLEKLPLKSYFNTMESILPGDISVEELTSFLTRKPFSESKPYLTRRQLIPSDTRFKKIEIVYKDVNKVNAIVWELDVPLSQLIDMFGEPIISNEPYSNSTTFAFRSTNPSIEIIKTRHSKWLTLLNNEKFEYQDKQHKILLSDPEFTFIQFSMSLT